MVRMNMFSSQHPDSLLVNVLWCIRVEFDSNLEAVSCTILNNLRLKRRVYGESKDIAIFTTEQERIEAIEREFGIKLTREEQDGIKHRKVAVDKLEILDPQNGQWKY
jgi:hypothetical protein